ncbi:MAG: phospho-N-acetylmuramoyl-pentapeptide-transferase [Spirochaetales bacterium]|nr:phospho-N-acetylmuramoyl-pentapeptide-transferase [Spirochaetales bacterium]
MLHLLSRFQTFFGPLRLLGSYSFLIVIGLYLGFMLSIVFLPKLSRFLPHDGGRDFAVQGKNSKGKPTGAGILFIPLFAAASIISVPYSPEILAVIFMTLVTALSGFLDDKSLRPWGEYKKGLIDLTIAAAMAVILVVLDGTTIWLPFSARTFELSKPVYALLTTVVIWTSINTTNCSDGVDGLSGTLVLICLITIGLIFYFVLGHVEISEYLLLPHSPEGAKWAILTFTLTGSLLAYLWYNAYPSTILMGDAGSRALGFFIGVAVIKTGNPFILLIVSTVLLVNGGTGLLKVAVLRFLKVRIFHTTRFPLHDHMRENRKWSNTQVLLKFVILQILITTGFLGIMLKIR